MICGAIFVRPAVYFITTAGVRGMKCGVEIVRPAVALITFN